MTRSYTVTEIDDLRSAVEKRLMWGNSNGPDFFMRPNGMGFSPSALCPKEPEIEAQVRTYMMAGITGDDLRNSDPSPVEYWATE